MVDLLLLVAIVGLLCGLRVMALAIQRPPEPPAAPLDFHTIEKRYPKVHLFASREEVVALLGPPNAHIVPDPDLMRWTEEAEDSHRGLGMPRNRVWEMWIDPKDEGRRVAILFAGGKVYAVHKKGF
jgi:hypothetical protein